MEVFWNGTVSTQFRVIRPKLCKNCDFPQKNFHTRKLGEITVFYVASSTPRSVLESNNSDLFTFPEIKYNGIALLNAKR